MGNRAFQPLVSVNGGYVGLYGIGLVGHPFGGRRVPKRKCGDLGADALRCRPNLSLHRGINLVYAGGAGKVFFFRALDPCW
jgi:hypothetical protein